MRLFQIAATFVKRMRTIGPEIFSFLLGKGLVLVLFRCAICISKQQVVS